MRAICGQIHESALSSQTKKAKSSAMHCKYTVCRILTPDERPHWTSWVSSKNREETSHKYRNLMWRDANHGYWAVHTSPNLKTQPLNILWWVEAA